MSKKKCMMCKSWITSETIEDVIGGKAMHFCSNKCLNKAILEQKQKEKRAADKDKVYKLICEIFGVPEIINTALWKEKIIWNKVKSDEIIAKYLEENKDYLTQVISRLSSSEYAKIRYLSTILKNNLGDYKPKVEVKEEIKENNFTLFEPVSNKKQNRRSFADMEESV